MLNSLALLRTCTLSPAKRIDKAQLFNARPIKLALRCSIRYLCIVVRRQSPLHGLTNSGRPKNATPRADSHCLKAKGLSTGFVCVCTHYLVFKEPTAKAPWTPRPTSLRPGQVNG